MVSGAITIGGGGSGYNFAFTVYGTNTLRYAQSFAGAVNTLLSGGDTITQLPPNGGDSRVPPVGTNKIDVLARDTSGGSTYNINNKNAYVIDSLGGALTIGLSGSDSVIVAAINARATVNGAGDNNQVVFVDGNNTFNGSTDTGDTIVGGTGFDTINTGGGATTVDSGTGDATIFLNDTGAGAYNDAVYLDDGMALVHANGTGDEIVATIGGQTIIGGAGSSSDVLTVVLLPNSDGSINGNDSITTGAAYANIIDESSNNTINGGDGSLTFFAGADNVTATINTGNGLSVLFGNTGADLTLGTVSGDTGNAAFIAGAGNETLNGALSTANLTLFGGNDSSGSDSLVGGAGSDTLVAGLGTDTLTGGAGDNSFLIDSSAAAGAGITISDFNTSDTLAFSGYTASDVANALSSGTETANGFVITFDSTNTTITLTGVTSASELTGHTITF